jgi:hypothetical protein
MAKARTPSDEKFSDAEAKKRLEAALRGARISGHKAKSEILPSRPAKKPKRKVVK